MLMLAQTEKYTLTSFKKGFTQVKQFEYIPECLKDESYVLKGRLVLKKPGGDAMFDLIDIQSKMQENQMLGIKMLIQWSEPFIVEVDCHHKVDGTHYKSFAELKEDIHSFKLLTETASFLAHLAEGKMPA